MADPKNDDFLDDLEALAAEADAQEEADEMAEPTDEIPCRRRRVAETNGLTGFISSLGLTTTTASTSVRHLAQRRISTWTVLKPRSTS